MVDIYFGDVHIEVTDEEARRWEGDLSGEWYPFDDTEDGNVIPDEGSSPPPIAYAIAYQIAKGFGIKKSLARISKFFINKSDMEQFLKEYRDIRDRDPSSGKYRDLIRAVANKNNFDYKYEGKEYGHLIKMWDDSGEEWQFPVKRGKYRHKDMEDRFDERGDYLSNLGVSSYDDTEKTDYMVLRDEEPSDLTDLYKKYVEEDDN